MILGIPVSECDGVYPRTRDGRCQGCGTTETPHPMPHAYQFKADTIPMDEMLRIARDASQPAEISMSHLESLEAVIRRALEDYSSPDHPIEHAGLLARFLADRIAPTRQR